MDRVRRRVGGDRGAETVSMAVLFPLALVLILLIVQAGLLWHARNVLAESAQAGVNAGRLHGATSSDAHQAAASFVARAGDDVIANSAVRTERGAERVSVTVTGSAPRLLPIPGVEFRLSAGASAPTERWTSP